MCKTDTTVRSPGRRLMGMAGSAVGIAVAGMVVVAGPAWPQTTESATFDVTATAQTTCTISTFNQDFGNYAGTELIIQGPTPGATVIMASLNCSVGFVDAVFCLDEGRHWNRATRRMRSTVNPWSDDARDNIDYEVYVAGSGFSSIIGETANGANTTPLNCNGGSEVHPGLEQFNDVSSGSEVSWDISVELKTLGGGTTPGGYIDVLTASFVFQ